MGVFLSTTETLLMLKARQEKWRKKENKNKCKIECKKTFNI